MLRCTKCRRDDLHPVALITEEGQPDDLPAEKGLFLWACFTCKRYLICRPWWA